MMKGGGEGEDVRWSVTELKEQDIDINLRPKIEDGKFTSYRGSASEAVGRGRAGMLPSVLYAHFLNSKIYFTLDGHCKQFTNHVIFRV